DVVAEVARFLQLTDEPIHHVEGCVGLNETTESIPVPAIEALDIGFEEVSLPEIELHLRRRRLERAKLGPSSMQRCFDSADRRIPAFRHFGEPVLKHVL